MEEGVALEVNNCNEITQAVDGNSHIKRLCPCIYFVPQEALLAYPKVVHTEVEGLYSMNSWVLEWETRLEHAPHLRRSCIILSHNRQAITSAYFQAYYANVCLY